MKRIVGAVIAVVAIWASAGVVQADETLSGAGSTFAAPLYAKWASDYRPSSGISLNYQSIGSGGGIKQIEARTVDFGASDKPLKPEVLDKFGLYQFPTVVGGVVPAVNIPGVAAGQLKLPGTLLADIYMGKITTWNDPAIRRSNPDLPLPALPITVVHRSDGSGTSFLFTSYLSLVSPQWKTTVGANDAVEWPTGVGGKGNEGVAALVRSTVGAVGYVEYAFVKKTTLSYALVGSKDGTWPQPAAASFKAAAAGADWSHAPGNYLLVLNQPGADAWPITGATFVLMYRNQTDARKGGAILKFFDYGYKAGDYSASSLYYVPLPASIKSLMRQQWAQAVTAAGKPVYVSPNP